MLRACKPNPCLLSELGCQVGGVPLQLANLPVLLGGEGGQGDHQAQRQTYGHCCKDAAPPWNCPGLALAPHQGWVVGCRRSSATHSFAEFRPHALCCACSLARSCSQGQHVIASLGHTAQVLLGTAQVSASGRTHLWAAFAVCRGKAGKLSTLISQPSLMAPALEAAMRSCLSPCMCWAQHMQGSTTSWCSACFTL